MSTILRRTKKKTARRPAKKAAEPEILDEELTDTEADTEPDEELHAAEVEDEDELESDVTNDEFEYEDDEDDSDEDSDEDEDEESESGEDDEFEFDDEDDLDDEADDEDDDEDEEAAQPGDPARVQFVLAILAVAALVLAGAVFYLRAQVNDARAADEADDAAVSAARAHAQDILSYDYRSLDNNFQAGLAASTGGFRKQYQQTTSQLVRPQALSQRVIVQAAVMNAGVVSATDDNAVVLLFVDRVTTKAGAKKPTFNQDRVQMTMTKVNGKWLVSKLDAL